jgi:hypothetical protein
MSQKTRSFSSGLTKDRDLYASKSPGLHANDNSFFHGQNPGEAEHAEAEVAVAPLLTDTQVRNALTYMRTSYAPQSIRLLRSRFSLDESATVDRDLVLAIAQYQDTNHLTVDGKLGPTSFDTLQAEGGEVMQDVVMFRVTSPLGGRMETVQGGGLTSMTGHFKVEVRLPPGEDCHLFEYRQFICGNVEFVPATAGPTDPAVNLNSLFTVPGGTLPPIPNYHEDGNTALHAQYGHRSLPARPENHYLDADGNEDQANGCIFKSFDKPGITDRACTPGEIYDFDFRFMGQVRHRDRGVIATRYWNVTDSVTT